MVKRAHVHHRDGDPTNNPSDGSNWEVLCPRCHRQIPGIERDGSGISIYATIAPWKRTEIIESRNSRCERCGIEVSIQRIKREGRLSMSKGQRYIIVDEYATALLQQIVDRGDATDLPEAVGISAATHLGIRYKSKQERKLEQDSARVAGSGKQVSKEANNGK